MKDSAKPIFDLPAFPAALCTGLIAAAVAFAMEVTAGDDGGTWERNCRKGKHHNDRQQTRSKAFTFSSPRRNRQPALQRTIQDSQPRMSQFQAIFEKTILWGYPQPTHKIAHTKGFANQIDPIGSTTNTHP